MVQERCMVRALRGVAIIAYLHQGLPVHTWCRKELQDRAQWAPAWLMHTLHLLVVANVLTCKKHSHLHIAPLTRRNRLLRSMTGSAA